MNLDELKTRATIALWPDTAQLLGVSKNSVYKSAKAGEIRVLRIGGRYLVPVAPLLKQLGIEPDREQP